MSTGTGERPLVFLINGEERSSDASPAAALVDVIRDSLGLTGTNIGCRTGDCGACTVLVEGRSAKTCVVLAGAVDGQHLETIEGFQGDDRMEIIRAAFRDNFGFQCGYCLPGMLITTYELLSRTLEPSEEELRQAINGNLCRCTGYQFILRSMRAAAASLREGAGRAVN
jgi:carbon-monoxide dehydrogenase small subunit